MGRHLPRAAAHPPQGHLTMTLLDLYLQAVALHLPRGADKADILAELAEHLRATMDDRKHELGRPLTEDEQKLVLAAHGEPLVVAQRYGGAHRGFAFGWQLISPQAFPAYVIALSLVLGMALLSNVALLVIGSESLLLQPRRLAATLDAFFVIVAVIYIGLDAFMRRASRASRAGQSAAALE